MSSPPPVPTVPQAAPAQGTTAAAASPSASTSAAAQQAEMAGNISSMADLQQQAPDVYKAMMQGIAMNICNDMAKQQEHLKEIQEEFRREEEEG
jgi:hypothetical protein